MSVSRYLRETRDTVGDIGKRYCKILHSYRRQVVYFVGGKYTLKTTSYKLVSYTLFHNSLTKRENHS